MIVSETLHQMNSRWLQACVLLCAATVLPMSVANAQDYDAVGKRLRAAVEAGELTGAQARIMLETLRNADRKPGDAAIDRAKTHLTKMKQELGKLVEAGKISEKDAKERYAAAEKGIKERMAAGRGEAREGEQKANAAREYLMKVRKELAAAVEAGKISEEEAKKKFASTEKAIRENMAAQRGEHSPKRISAEDLSRIASEIRKAVSEGKLSAEEGRAKMEAVRKMMAKQDAGSKRSERGGDAHFDLENIKKRIEGAVERGDMTREQANAKYKETRETLAKKRGDKR